LGLHCSTWDFFFPLIFVETYKLLYWMQIKLKEGYLTQPGVEGEPQSGKFSGKSSRVLAQSKKPVDNR